MRTTRDKFEPWLQEYLRPRYPDLESPLLAAIDAFDTIRRTKRVTSRLLTPIVEAASSSRGPLYENATTLLGRLTRSFKESRQAIERMAEDSRSHVRFNAILCISESTPRPFAIQLLRQALCDKSARVRGKAADCSGELRIRELVPELEEALGRERNDDASENIEFNLKLLRDGYILEPSDDKGFDLTTFTDSGGVSSRWVSRSELKRRGVKVIIVDLANDDL